MPSRPFLAACPSGVFGASATTCCHACAGAGQILLAERLDDADVQQRLDVLGIDLRATARTARARLIGLVRVVVGHAEIGRDVGVVRIERERLLVPRDRLRILLGVEVTCCRAARAAAGRSDSARPPLRAPAPAPDRSAPAAAADWRGRRRRRSAPRAPAMRALPAACWLPSTQPTIRPNRMPAMPKTMASALMGNAQDNNERRSQSTSARATSGSRSSSDVPCAGGARHPLLARAGRLGRQCRAACAAPADPRCWPPARSSARRAA